MHALGLESCALGLLPLPIQRQHMSLLQLEGATGQAGLPATFGILIGIGCALYSVSSVLALLINIAAKWIIIGRRSPGNYNW
jgi:hypothetical protein